MATFRKRGRSWRVELWVGGVRRSATFDTKQRAQAWADQEQARLREGRDGDIPNRPFRDLLERYAREVSSAKRGARQERNMIAVMLRDPIADVMLPKLSARDFADWRDRRLKQVTGPSVNRAMAILSHACNIARREWGWLKDNPVAEVRRPPAAPARTRRPTEQETEALLRALGYSADQPPVTRSARVGAAWLFAIETAMRAGEICNLTWAEVHERHVHLPHTKNGHARDVPLSREARRIVEQLRPVTCNAGTESDPSLPRKGEPSGVNRESDPSLSRKGESSGAGTVFDVSSPVLDALFRKAKAACGIIDLHFHDSRREALTRLSKVYDVMALARVSGHRDLRILQNVYYRPSIEDLAAKLD